MTKCANCGHTLVCFTPEPLHVIQVVGDESKNLYYVRYCPCGCHNPVPLKECEAKGK